MLKLIQYLKASRFVRNMSVVMSGTAVAQLIGFSLTPIISRLFDPSDFGVFGSFIAISNVVAAGVTLQYSQAIMLPKEDKDAANIFAVSVLSVLTITLFGIFTAYIFSDRLLGILNAPEAKWLLWFLPFGIFIDGVNQSFQGWCIRRKAFDKTACSQIVRSGSTGALQIASGLFQFGGTGLIAAFVAGNGAASMNLSRRVFVTDRVLLKSSLAWNRIRRLAVEYRDFPMYAATQNVMNALSQGLPVIFLGYFYGIAIAGAYAFGMRLLKAPMNFVLIALRQVLFQKVSEAYNAGQDLFPLFIKTTLGLAAIALPPSILLILWAPGIFTWAFGEQWLTAGEYARWIVLWLMVTFCDVPSVLFAKVLRKQKQLFFYEIFQSSLRIGSLVIGGLYFNAYTTVIIFSMVGIVLNSILIAWITFEVKYKLINSDIDIPTNRL